MNTEQSLDEEPGQKGYSFPTSRCHHPGMSGTEEPQFLGAITRNKNAGNTSRSGEWLVDRDKFAKGVHISHTQLDSLILGHYCLKICFGFGAVRTRNHVDKDLLF